VRERERGGELTSGSKSGDHRLQNLGHHGGERERGGRERRLLRGRIE
jgi:general stress protein YciG